MADNQSKEPTAVVMSDDEQVVQQIITYQASVYRFILSLVGNYGDAEDVLQQTMLTVWQKRDARKTEDLLPWALSIAKNHVRNHVRKVARRSNLTGLTEDALERVAAAQEKLAEQPSQRQQALEHCLEKLPAEHRALVEEYYDRNLTPEQLATKFDKSVDAFYKSVQRIRRVLFDCINAQLAAGETHGN